MSRAWKHLAMVGLAALLGMGCRSTLPSGSTTTKSPWKDFREAKVAYDRIVPTKTTEAELRQLGYDPFNNPNIKVLSHLDVMQRFLPNSSVRLEALPVEVRAFIESPEGRAAYELEVNVLKSERYGNTLADIPSFSRKTKETGWSFKAIILTNTSNVVVYKLWSGQPHIERYEDRTKPLGPLQNVGDIKPPMPY